MLPGEKSMGKTILITAGGTSEPIDPVRKISNSGSGRLSSLIADEYAKHEEVDKIIYICSMKALLPNTEKKKVVRIDTVQQLADAVGLTLLTEKVDIIVHAIAVSDYRVRNVTTVEALAKEIGPVPASAEVLRAGLDTAALPRDTKLSSDMGEVIVQLEQTPKVISMLRPMAPKAKIVGFKLLTEVAKDELLSVARALGEKNDCDFVLANDLMKLDGDRHEGFLLGRDGAVVGEFHTKQEIAEGIVEATL